MSGQVIFEEPVHVGHLEPVHPPRLHEAFKDLLTLEEVQNLAKLVTSSPTVELVDYYLRPYSEEKIGFLASHLCLVLEIQRLDGKIEKYSLFVKTVPLDVPTQAAYIEEKGCFRKEADFLKLLVPLMTDGWSIEPWTPKCYLVKKTSLSSRT